MSALDGRIQHQQLILKLSAEFNIWIQHQHLMSGFDIAI